MSTKREKLVSLNLFAALIFCISGCEKLRVEPVSVKGESIVGHWFAEQNSNEDKLMVRRKVYLQVREDGYARYYSLLCEKNLDTQLSSSRSLELDFTPIKRLNRKKILLQRYPLTPQFELTIGHWPVEDSNLFEVDQIQLHPIPETNVPDLQDWGCEGEASD